MPHNRLDPEEMQRLNEQLANDSFANEGGPRRRIQDAREELELTDATRVVSAEEINRDSELDDG
ncbi:MAG: hypothetical protein GX572_03920 [Clostridia bacterium]|nr:hypothetical protein [Clostridia bacterium]